MKKFKGLFVMWLCALVLLPLSCSKDDAVPLNQKKYGGTVSFTANGQVNSFSQNSFYSNSGLLELTSLLGTKEQLTLRITSGIAETTYDLKNQGVGIVYFDDAGNYYSNPTGQVVITKIDETNKTISGTFSAKLDRPSPSATVNISNGVFTNVPFAIEDRGKGNVNIAKIDGVQFAGRLNEASSVPSFVFGNSTQLLSFSFSNTTTVGKTYNVTDLVVPRNYVKYVEGLYSFAPKSGSFTITKYTPSNEIQGTFAFEMESYPIGGKIKSITEGTFAVNLP
jgi:Family of unknown function (DUF6252)